MGYLHKDLCAAETETNQMQFGSEVGRLGKVTETLKAPDRTEQQAVALHTQCAGTDCPLRLN